MWDKVFLISVGLAFSLGINLFSHQDYPGSCKALAIPGIPLGDTCEPRKVVNKVARTCEESCSNGDACTNGPNKQANGDPIKVCNKCSFTALYIPLAFSYIKYFFVYLKLAMMIYKAVLSGIKY